MVKRISDYGEYYYDPKDIDPDTKKPKRKDSKGKLLMTMELVNQLAPEDALDLQFKMGFTQYEDMFKRELGFSSKAEMDAMKAILDKINEYDTANKDYIVIAGVNCHVLVKTSNKEDLFNLGTQPVMDYFLDILKWMHKQDKHTI
jgi:hypothetical protein